jgi:hypothetical protein
MFELVHPDDPHVILYQNRHLYYLMSRNRKTGEYHYHNELGKFETPDEYQLTLNDIINDIESYELPSKIDLKSVLDIIKVLKYYTFN